MRLKPHLLGILVILLIIISIFIHYSKGIYKSTFVLDSQENRFTLKFDLRDKDKNNLSKILEKLNVAQSALNGLNFHLDATSSAALAYLVPVTADISANTNSITFTGKTSHNLLAQNLSIDNIKAPKSANLIVFAPNLLDFIVEKTNYPQNLKNWLKSNFSDKNGQYLIVFGPNPDFALIAKKDNVDLTTLKDIQVNKDGLSYKEEARNGINYYLLNVPQDPKSNNQTTLAFFTEDNWTIFASSREAAFLVSDTINSKSDSISFPNNKVDERATLVVFMRNFEKDPISSNLINFILAGASDTQANAQKLKNTLESLQEITLILAADKFSGLINIK